MKEIKCTESKKGKENLQRLPRSCGCPTNPFHPFLLKIWYPSGGMFLHFM